jgi:hypothetical protein
MGTRVQYHSTIIPGTVLRVRRTLEYQGLFICHTGVLYSITKTLVLVWVLRFSVFGVQYNVLQYSLQSMYSLPHRLQTTHYTLQTTHYRLHTTDYTLYRLHTIQTTHYRLQSTVVQSQSRSTVFQTLNSYSIQPVLDGGCKYVYLLLVPGTQNTIVLYCLLYFLLYSTTVLVFDRCSVLRAREQLYGPLFVQKEGVSR